MTETEKCPRSIRYAPMNGETGRPYPEVHVHCTRDTGHAGFHHGNDGMPFGPWIDPAASPAPTANGAS